MGCLCCVSGPLNVTVRTDRSAYCKGELMTVTVYANNQTSYSILGVELELVQDTIYIASGGKLISGFNLHVVSSTVILLLSGAIMLPVASAGFFLTIWT